MPECSRKDYEALDKLTRAIVPPEQPVPFSMVELADSMKKRPSDTNRLAKQIIDEATADKNPAAVALGRLGGLKGGKARAAKLSPEKRAEIAKSAASARWKKS
jgi:hypothetical protein